jgi:flagellar motor switch protein FliN/FliY
MSSLPNSSSSSDLSIVVADRIEHPLRGPANDALAPLHDVTCRVDVVLGSASMTVRECLNLTRNAILRLAQPAGNDMQVVVNGIAIADGEVVIIDNTTAVRITDILAPPSNEATA